MSGIKVLLTLISTLTSNIAFIQLSSLLSGYPASSFFGINAKPMYVSLEHNSDYVLLAVARVQCGRKLPFANSLVSGSEHFFLS